MTVKIPIIKKTIACVECRVYCEGEEADGKKPGWCELKQRPTKEVALECQPKKSWKKK